MPSVSSVFVCFYSDAIDDVNELNHFNWWRLAEVYLFCI